MECIDLKVVKKTASLYKTNKEIAEKLNIPNRIFKRLLYESYYFKSESMRDYAIKFTKSIYEGKLEYKLKRVNEEN